MEVKTRTLRNNGRKIGVLLTYDYNLKNEVNIQTHTMTSIPALISASIENDIDEQRYNIPYTVKIGDSLQELVQEYEPNPKKRIKYINKIEEQNHINGQKLHGGEKITLIGVPSSKLEAFGYTDNYNYFDITVEIDLRISYIEKIIDNMAVENKLAQNLITKYQKVLSAYNDYNQDDLPGTEYLLEKIAVELRNLTELASKIATGVTFESSLIALPLDASPYYNQSRKI